MFHYEMILTVTVEAEEYELHREFDSAVQFRAGDTIVISSLDTVTIESVEWGLPAVGCDRLERGFIILEDIDLKGTKDDWRKSLARDFAYSLGCDLLQRENNCGATTAAD